MNQVRTACLRDGGFGPKLLPIGNTFDSLISMVAAGRGVVMASEIVLRNLHLPAAVKSHILEDSQSKFELFLLRRKESGPVAVVNNFAKILFGSVRRLQSYSKGAKRLMISSSARLSGSDRRREQIIRYNVWNAECAHDSRNLDVVVEAF
jgi:hypothetical protein